MALYYIGLACLFTHELDAVTHSEWRLLFGLRDLPDPTAASAFVALHVPLFFLVLWLSHHPSPRLSTTIESLITSMAMTYLRSKSFSLYFINFCYNFGNYGNPKGP